MKFLAFIRHSESFRDGPPPAGFMQHMGKFVQKYTEQGAVVDTGGLAGSKEGSLVRLRKGKVSVTDGPFTESKEVIGGWVVLNLPTRADAVRVAVEFMELHRDHWPGFEGEAEVRPMLEMGPPKG